MAGMAKSRPNTVPLMAMNAEEAAVQLAKSMQPYFRFAMADISPLRSDISRFSRDTVRRSHTDRES